MVVDCGTSRVPRFDPDVGVTRLETVRVSRASADQRRGRAGRMEPGVCYRLWDEAETASLMPFSEPEIRAADLAPSCSTARSGASPIRARSRGSTRQPLRHSMRRGRNWPRSAPSTTPHRLTDTGRRLRSLPLPPRLAAMLIAAAEIRAEIEAAEIAAVLVERGIGGNDTSLDHRLDMSSAATARVARPTCGAWPRVGREQRAPAPRLPKRKQMTSRLRLCWRWRIRSGLRRRVARAASFCSPTGAARMSMPPTGSPARRFSSWRNCRAARRLRGFSCGADDRSRSARVRGRSRDEPRRGRVRPADGLRSRSPHAAA